MPANDESDVGDDVPDFPYMTPEERKSRWLKLIEELSFREKDLLHFLWNQGADPRPPGEVRELIHEVMNGAAEVPAVSGVSTDGTKSA